jgi:hypothetical protein
VLYKALGLSSALPHRSFPPLLPGLPFVPSTGSPHQRRRVAYLRLNRRRHRATKTQLYSRGSS